MINSSEASSSFVCILQHGHCGLRFEVEIQKAKVLFAITGIGAAVLETVNEDLLNEPEATRFVESVTQYLGLHRLGHSVETTDGVTFTAVLGPRLTRVTV